MGDCIEFSGAKLPSGYGKLGRNGRAWLAHRWAWTEIYGEIPEGMYVCHQCDNPSCINIDHLFLGTPSDNAKDRVQKGRHHNTHKTHCPQGHPYDEENTLIRKDGKRQCRACNNAARLKRYYLLKE